MKRRQRARLERVLSRPFDAARLTVDGCTFDLNERELRELGADLLRVLDSLARERTQEETQFMTPGENTL